MRKIKLGLYGCGNRTRALLDSLFYDDEFEVSALYDIRKESAESAAEKYGGKVCDNTDELVSCPDVEAFIISLDPLCHPQAFYQTLKAGKPIFMEKPIAMTAAEAKKMMNMAEENDVPVHVGFMRRYLQKHIEARKFIEENDPGRIFSVNCRWFHPGETEMINCLNTNPDNFRMKLSQIPFHCCHSLDVMLLYGGPATRVTSKGLKQIDRPYPSPDEVIATIEFASGAIGSFHYCSMAYKTEISYVIHAENYTIDFNGGLNIWKRPPLKSLRQDGSFDCRATYTKNIGPESRTFGAGSMPDHLILGDFLDSVRNNIPMKVPIRDAVETAELAEAIERSWQENCQIGLPLEN